MNFFENLRQENTGFSLDGSVSIPSWDRFGLEHLLKYCGRPSFSSENIRWNGRKVTYKLPKPNRRGQTSIQLDPIECIDRIATLIPISHRHRRHYFGVFAPNSPLRKLVVANAKRHPENFVPSPLKLLSDKVHKASLQWVALIARIYEVNPLICSKCAGKVKIVGFVTHRIEILAILQRIDFFQNLLCLEKWAIFRQIEHPILRTYLQIWPKYWMLKMPKTVVLNR